MFDRQNKKSILVGVLSFVLLTLLLLFFLDHLDQAVFDILAQTTAGMLCLLLAMSCLYYVLDSILYVAVFRDEAHRFTLRDGIALTYLGIFGKAAVITGGSVPLQTIFLHRRGVAVGCSLGVSTVLTIMQKLAVVLYATVLLLLHWRWVRTVTPGIAIILVFSYGISALIILVLLLLCTSRRICDFSCRMISLLPQKLGQRKTKWQDQINTLYQQSQMLLQTKEKFLLILVLDLVKLFVLFCIPYAVLSQLGLHPYHLLQAQTLAALTLLLSGSIPNIAGMGSAELAFMIVYSQSLESYTAATMIYYRCATYYFPFIISVFLVFFIQKRLSSNK